MLEMQIAEISLVFSYNSLESIYLLLFRWWICLGSTGNRRFFPALLRDGSLRSHCHDCRVRSLAHGLCRITSNWPTTLSFFHFINSISFPFQVCLLEASTPVLFDCQPLQTGHIIVDLPALNRPFRIALRATAEDQGLVIVDNIQVKVCILVKLSSVYFFIWICILKDLKNKNRLGNLAFEWKALSKRNQVIFHYSKEDFEYCPKSGFKIHFPERSAHNHALFY